MSQIEQKKHKQTITSPLACLYKFESETPDNKYMTQPRSDGQVQEYTWKQTAELVRKLAARIKTYEFAAGSRIAILAKNTAEWIITDLAIMMAGHVSVPIFATAGSETISYVLEHAECQMLFIGKLDSYDAVNACDLQNVVSVSFPYDGAKASVSWDAFLDIGPMQTSPEPDMNETMTIIYTSGSTGNPKGVVHTYNTICWAGCHSINELEVNEQDRALSYLPLAHITERVLIELCSLYSGMNLYFVESLESFARDVRNCSPTLFISVPRLWTKFQLGVLAKLPQHKLNLLLKLPFIGKKVATKIKAELGFSDVRLWASGSAPLAPALISWFNTLGINISEGWGMTENSAYGTSTVPFRKDKIGSIGKAYDGVDIRIAEDGEIQVKSPCNMVGYYKDAEKTAETFTDDGYLRTGDKGEIDNEGFIKITGRLKDIFKTEKGKYVAPAPIEAKIMENSAVEQVCVTGTNLPQPIALLVLSEEAKKYPKHDIQESLQATLNEINASLESHQRLDRIIVFLQEWSIENGLLTPTLKVKRHVIEERFLSVIQGTYSEKVIWQD